MKGRFRDIINENLAGILATIIFHMVLVIIFLVLKISSVQNLMDNIIAIDFEEPQEKEIINGPERERNTELDRYIADYLESDRSNIPVNLAQKLDEQISTDRFVDEVTDDLSSSRTEEMLRNQERLRELQEMESEDIIAETGAADKKETMVFTGKTNIFYSLENRYHLRLPVPVYKCEGFGIIEVQILVDQKGSVVSVHIPDVGESSNDICLAEAAKTAALGTRFNSNYDAPLRQQGTITYHFQPQ